MKRFLFFILALFLILTASSDAFSAEIEAEGSPQRKLQRGFLNIALSPIEISNELAKEIKNDTFPPSWVIGLGRGAVMMVGRALAGVYEMVTFPIPYPAKYEPVVRPEFAWQHFEKTSEN